jgi:hypothetical protein
MAREKRGLGMIERRTSASTGTTTGYRARYMGPDLQRHSRTFTAKRDAEAWLAIEERLISRDEWRPPKLGTQPGSIPVLRTGRRSAPREP